MNKCIKTRIRRALFITVYIFLAFASVRPAQSAGESVSTPTLTLRSRDGQEKGTFMPRGIEHHRERLDRFRAEAPNVPAGCTLLVGDSITEAFPIQLIDPAQHPVNRGIGGMMIGGGKYLGLYDLLDDIVLNTKPSRIYLMIGINDFLQAQLLGRPGERTPLDEMTANYDKILSDIHSALPNCKIYVESLFPLGRNFADLNPQVNAFNARLKQLAAKHNCVFVDINKDFRDEQGNLPEAFSGDGIHPNLEAYRKWVELMPEIKPAGL